MRAPCRISWQLAEQSDRRPLEALVVLLLHQQAEPQRVLEVKVATLFSSLVRELELPAVKSALEPSVRTGPLGARSFERQHVSRGTRAPLTSPSKRSGRRNLEAGHVVQRALVPGAGGLGDHAGPCSLEPFQPSSPSSGPSNLTRYTRLAHVAMVGAARDQLSLSLPLPSATACWA
jgi:hypothetical protein